MYLLFCGSVCDEIRYLGYPLVALNIALAAFRPILLPCSRDPKVQILKAWVILADVTRGVFSVIKAKGTKDTEGNGEGGY